MEQQEVLDALRGQSIKNSDRLSFDDSIKRIADTDEIRLAVDQGMN